MSEKVIKNVSMGLLKKLFSKDRMDGIALTEDGFAVLMEKAGRISVPFAEVKAVEMEGYLDKMPPYRTVRLVLKNRTVYTMDFSSDKREADEMLRHFAHFQLGGEIPNDPAAIRADLQWGLNDYRIRLEDGNLIVTKHGQEESYPLSSLEYYRTDKPSNSIHMKFQEKKLFVTVSANHCVNVWLLLTILEKFSQKK